MGSLTIPAVMDIEASGFGRGSYPIEVGYILENGDTYCSLIRPMEDWSHWDVEAENLHGITRDALFKHGRAALDIARQLNEALKGMTLYSDAWGQDNSWLQRLFHDVGVWPTFKLESIRCIISESQIEFWNGARKEVELELAIPRHRASSDARLIQQTYLRSLQKGRIAV